MQFFLLAAFAALAVALPSPYSSSSGSGWDNGSDGSNNGGSGSGSNGGNGGNNNGGNGGNGGDGGNGNNNNAAGPICTAGWTPQCCQTDVLGLVGLTCDAPSFSVNSKQSLVDNCASTGTTAQCCLIPVAGQGLICADV